MAFKMSKLKNPCWKGYEMVGTKKKGSKTVPNCVPTSKNVMKKKNCYKMICPGCTSKCASCGDRKMHQQKY